MFRPLGAWWITGKVISFSLSGDSLTLVRVRNDFGIFHGYDLGGPGVVVEGIATNAEYCADFSGSQKVFDVLNGCGDSCFRHRLTRL